MDLHSGTLLPIMRKIGIHPTLMLVTELGRFGRFLDVYRYQNLAEYERLTDELIRHPDLSDYYAEIGQCIHGSIEVEIMSELPYARDWARGPATSR
jgi:hypothetical protein